MTKKNPPKQPPIWLRRLDVVKAEMKTVRFPKTAAEGFRQCAELSETARPWFLDSIRQEHPGWNTDRARAAAAPRSFLRR